VKVLVAIASELFAWDEQIISKTIRVKWEDLGLEGTQQVRDLWRQKDLGEFTEEFELKFHTMELVCLR